MEIAAILAINTMAVGVVGYLLKLWIDKRLSHSLSEELEKFKAELVKDVSLYTIQNTWIHNKKVELLSELYSSMIDADFELKAFLMNIKVQNKDLITSRASKFIDKYLELNSYLHKNELFLEQSLVNDIRVEYKPFFDVALSFMDKDFDFDWIAEALPNRLEEIMDVGDSPRSRLVEKFRAAVGINLS